jgi:cell wall-associated NlpC family hydrolase
VTARLLSPEPAMPRPRVPITDAVEAEQRAAVICEALTWVGTPYRQCGAVKGAGVDCGMLLVRVWIEAGVVEEFDPRPYPAEWHLHNPQERYLGWMLQCACNTNTPQPGDMVLFWFGRCFSHGAILISDTHVVHAPAEEGRVRILELNAHELSWMDHAQKRRRPRLFFDPWARFRQISAGA